MLSFTIGRLDCPNDNTVQDAYSTLIQMYFRDKILYPQELEQMEITIYFAYLMSVPKYLCSILSRVPSVRISINALSILSIKSTLLVIFLLLLLMAI